MSDMDNTSPAPEGAATPNPPSKVARRRARELALQGVYQWLLSANTMITVQRHLESETENLDKIDRELFVSLLRGAIGGADELRGHFELVSNEMGAGVTRVGLDTGLPIANGVLTTENDDQAIARMREKGADCARAAVEMANLLKAVR